MSLRLLMFAGLTKTLQVRSAYAVASHGGGVDRFTARDGSTIYSVGGGSTLRRACACDLEKNLYAAEFEQGTANDWFVRKYSPSGSVLWTSAEDIDNFSTGEDSVVVTPQGYVFIIDNDVAGRVRRLDGSDGSDTVWTAGWGGGVVDGMAANAAGDLWLCGQTDRLERLDSDGTRLFLHQSTWQSGGAVEGNNPGHVSVDDDDNAYVTSAHGICCIDADGDLVWAKTWSSTSNNNVRVSPDGVLYNIRAGTIEQRSLATGDLLDTVSGVSADGTAQVLEVDGNGFIYTVTTADKLIQIDPDDLTVVWESGADDYLAAAADPGLYPAFV